MGSRDGDPPAGAKESHSSDKRNASPFVDTYEGYTWDQEAGEWTHDVNHERHSPSPYEARSPAGPPFDSREPLPDDSGMRHSTPDERGHIDPSDEYARCRSNSAQSFPVYWSPDLPLHEGRNRRSRSIAGEFLSNSRLNVSRSTNTSWARTGVGTETGTNPLDTCRRPAARLIYQRRQINLGPNKRASRKL